MVLLFLSASWSISADAATQGMLRVEPRLVITTTTAGPASAFLAFDGHPPKLFDVNLDGVIDVLVQNDNRRAYVVDSANGALLAELVTTFPSTWTGGGNAGDHKAAPEAAILAQGQRPSVIVYNAAAVVTLFQIQGMDSTGLVVEKRWERRLTDCHSNPTNDARPVLADLNNDGGLDILLQSEESGVYALNARGETLWRRCLPGGNAEPAVADLDGDGSLEVITVSDSGDIHALRGDNGATKWRYDVRSHGLGSASMPVGATIAQIDGHGPLDLIVGARDSHDALDWSQNHAALLALSGDGRLLWLRQDPGGAPLTYTHVVVVDEDLDGRPDIFWADWNNIGHKPPWDEADAWKRTGPAHVYRYDSAGTLVWRQSVDTPDHDMDIALADTNGDGRQEVLVAAPNAGRHGVLHLDARTGNPIAFSDTHPWIPNRGPVLEQVNGGTRMVVPASQPDGTAGALIVFDYRVPFNALWPHVAYASLPKAPPPRTVWEAESFRATAGGRSSSSEASGGAYWNLWSNGYLEGVYQSDGKNGTHIVARATPAAGIWPRMRVEIDGATVAEHTVASRTFQSYPIPIPISGSHQIRLVYTNDAVIGQEDRNLHLDALVHRGAPVAADPVDPPAFSAEYRGVRGNEWWVQASVSASRAITAVEFSTDNATWHALSKQSWGAWATSRHLPPGSIVRLRATADDGARAHSPCYAWIPPSHSDAATRSCEPSAPISDPMRFSGVKGNTWWVQVQVQASQSVQKVEARVDCGTWIMLDNQGWGWARSFHVPAGSKVDFRGTTSSATGLSSAYVWPEATPTTRCP